MNAVARGLDVGFGNVKMTLGDGFTPASCFSFPSIAVRKFSSDPIVDPDVVEVQIDGVSFLVGTGIRRYMSNGSTRYMMEDYADTREYKALVLGGLYFMNQAHIDRLVVGLPVNTIGRKKSALQWIKGVHEVGGRRIWVEEMDVLAQPLGGYAAWLTSLDLMTRAARQKEGTLIVDPGYYSLDWVVMEGRQISRGRSGALSHGGMGRIIRSIAREMGSALGLNLDYELMYGKIEQALRKDGWVSVNGERVNTRNYVSAANAMTSEAIVTMMNSLQQTTDIENVVMVGGGASFYEEGVRNAMCGRRIETPQFGEFSNALGYHAIGRQAMNASRAETLQLVR